MKFKKLKLFIIIFVLCLFNISIVAADWELGQKSPAFATSYRWDSSMSMDNSLQTAWNQARSSWTSSVGATYYYMSDSNYKQGLMKETSSTLYGQINYPVNILEIMTSYLARVNIGNSKVYSTNVARSTATHELGHSWGLDDLTSGTSIMNGNRNRGSLYTPQSIDISRVKSLYK